MTISPRETDLALRATVLRLLAVPGATLIGVARQTQVPEWKVRLWRNQERARRLTEPRPVVDEPFTPILRVVVTPVPPTTACEHVLREAVRGSGHWSCTCGERTRTFQRVSRSCSWSAVEEQRRAAFDLNNDSWLHWGTGDGKPMESSR